MSSLRYLFFIGYRGFVALIIAWGWFFMMTPEIHNLLALSGFVFLEIHILKRITEYWERYNNE